MVKGTNNLIYEFVSGDANEITKVATALHDALRGNRLYIHSKIVLHWADDGFVMVDIPDVESCYKQLPKFLTTYVEFNKFVKNVIDDPCETVSETNYGETNNSDLQSHCENQRKEINLLLKQKEKLEKKLEAFKKHQVDMMAYRDDIIGKISREKNELENANKSQLRRIEKMEENMKNGNEQYKKLNEQYKNLKDDYDVLEEKYEKRCAQTIKYHSVHEMFDMLFTAEFIQKKEEKKENKEDI